MWQQMWRRGRRRSRCREQGFTLIEVIVAMAVFGILVSISVMGLNAYSSAQAEKGTADGLVALLRSTAQQAQSEGRTYCVSFDSSTTWSVWRYSCDPSWQSGAAHATEVSSDISAQSPAYLSTPSFTAPAVVGMATTCPASCVYFYPRGIASSGSVQIHRRGTSKVYTVNVEGLTSRAYLG